VIQFAKGKFEDSSLICKSFFVHHQHQQLLNVSKSRMQESRIENGISVTL
jgi:hypothetical protein